MTSAVLQDRGFYNGAIGKVVDIVFRSGERPPASPPRIRPCEVPEISRTCLPRWRPEVAPNCANRSLTRLPAPLIPAHDPDRSCLRGVTSRKSHGATCGAGCDAERVVVHPSDPSFGKSHPGGLYAAFPQAKSAGRGSYGEPGCEPSALYLHPRCSSERILIRVARHITDGRGAGISEIRSSPPLRGPGTLTFYRNTATSRSGRKYRAILKN